MSQTSTDSDGQKVIDFIKLEIDDKLYDLLLQTLIEDFKGFKVKAIFDDAHGHNVVMNDIRIKINAKSKKSKEIKIGFNYRDIVDNKNLFNSTNYSQNFRSRVVDHIVSKFIKSNIEKYENEFGSGSFDKDLVYTELLMFVERNYIRVLDELIKESEFFIKFNEELLILVKEYIGQEEFNQELRDYLDTYMNEYMGKIVSASSRFGLSLEDLKNKLTEIYVSEIQNS